MDYAYSYDKNPIINEVVPYSWDDEIDHVRWPSRRFTHRIQTLPRNQHPRGEHHFIEWAGEGHYTSLNLSFAGLDSADTESYPDPNGRHYFHSVEEWAQAARDDKLLKSVCVEYSRASGRYFIRTK